MAFDIDQALARWRRSMRKQHGLEPGFVEELESNLHDRYDDFLIQGLSPEEAFARASARVTPEGATDEGRPAGSGSRASSWPWRSSALFYLLPSYLKVAGRHLRRRPFYKAVNYVSLAIGLLCASLAGMYLHYETSYDAFVPDADRKYRLGRTFRSQDYSVMSFDGYFGADPEVQMKQINGMEAIPGVAYGCQFYTFGQPAFVRADSVRLPTEDLLQTNTPAAFFDFFGWPFLLGSAADFSETLHAAVLTESQAERFFGADWRSKDLLQKHLEIDETVFAIKGVIEDIPPNAHYTFSIALYTEKIEYWGARTYVALERGTDPETVARRMDERIASINMDLAESTLFGGTIIQPIRSIHLNSDMLYELKPPGDKRYLYIIGILSGIILLLTLSNYTNLSIAMNAGRSREIAMRKIFGAREWQVSFQFILESMVLSLLTLPVVGLALYRLIPYFNDFMGTGLRTDRLLDPRFWGILVAAGLLIGLLASLYPAFYLARHRIVELFQDNLVQNNFSGLSTRKAIITLQFVLLIGLCSLTLLVNRQLHYMQEKDLGFEEEQVLYVNLSEDSTQFELFRNALRQLPAVTGVGSGSPLGRTPFNQTTYKLAGTEEVFDDAHDIALDYQAVDLLDIETSIPDYVARPEAAPRELVLINETLADKLSTAFGLSRGELLGRTIIEEPEYTDPETGRVGFPFVISGTFADINMFSLRERVEPMFLTVYKEPGYVRWASIGWQGEGPAEVLEQVERTFQRLYPDKTFVYSFLTQNIEELYAKERRVARLSILFSLIAFGVAVIGLVALTAFLTALKRKEIGLRKILGASHFDILLRFNREYWWLVLIALGIATPLTFLGVSRWLDRFAYRISIDPAIFLFAGLITLLIASLAVSLMILRVANALPARALQEEQ